MTPEQFNNYLDNVSKEFKQFIENDLPDVVGTEAVNHFRQSFIDGGFTDAVLDKWAPRKHKYGNDTKDGKEVLTQSGDLSDSIIYTILPGGVLISTDKIYAQIHNEGGTIKIPVTKKLKSWAWAMWYNSGRLPEDRNPLYKSLALTNKASLTITMQRRQFIGDSIELDRKITEKIERTINKIFE